MGNYLPSFPFKKNVYQSENNNKMDTSIALHVEETKISNCLNLVDVPAALTVNKLQHECKKDSSVIMKMCSTLYNFYNKPYLPCTTNLLDRSDKVDFWEENGQSVASTKKIVWINEREVDSDFRISFKYNSKQYREDCIQYKSPTAFDLNTSVKINQIVGGKSPSERYCKNKCKEESGEFINLRLDSKRYQKPQVQDYIKQLQDQPVGKLTFQRLDSGIEDSPYPFRTRTHIDPDSLYLSTIAMDNEHCCPISEHLIIGTETGFQKSISFFIDIRDPLKQKPLRDEYKFSVCSEMFSSECDSMFSDKCSESSDQDCIDDFIIFEESSSEDKDDYGFNLTLNACSTPVELSCSVSANSTVATCVDISFNTSPYGGTNCDKSSRKSATSVKIDIPASACSHNNQRLVTNCTVFQKYNFPNTSECLTFPTSDITTDESCPVDICSKNEKEPNIEANINISSFGECTHMPDCTHEVSAKETSSMLETSDLDACTKKRKKPQKKVCFVKEEDLVVVYQMRHWDFAYREARKGTWELAAVDRCRFWRRIKDLELILSPCLKRKLESIKNI